MTRLRYNIECQNHEMNTIIQQPIRFYFLTTRLLSLSCWIWIKVPVVEVPPNAFWFNRTWLLNDKKNGNWFVIQCQFSPFSTLRLFHSLPSILKARKKYFKFTIVKLITEINKMTDMFHLNLQMYTENFNSFYCNIRIKSSFYQYVL